MQVSLLSVINGSDGSKRGHDIISSVVDAIITPAVQAQFTWTGKSDKNHKKQRFDENTEIIGVIFIVCRQADEKYAKSDCIHDLTYKVFKNAHQRW